MRCEKYELESLALSTFKESWSNTQRNKEVTNEIYNELIVLNSQLVSWKTNESITIRERKKYS